MRRGLERNTQVTNLSGLGFGHGPIDVGFSLDVGRGYPHDMVKPHWPRVLATPRHPSHAPPYPFEISFWS
ncbi:hypothetical protein Hanom_Chr01g00084771 [Helianthus anomalus]